jgi:hypothetical protein
VKNEWKLGLIFGTGNGTGFRPSSGFGTKTEPRPSSKIGTKEPVLSLDQRFLKIIQPVLALSQKSKNWVKAPTINQWLFRFCHKNCRFFEFLKNLRTGGSFDFNKLEIFQNLRTGTWGFR